jgi:hypothetical protein
MNGFNLDRKDTVWTQVIKARILRIENYNTFCSFNNNRIYNELYILNKWGYNMVQMTIRHNMVQDKLMKAIKKHRKLKDDNFRNNQTVSLDKVAQLQDIGIREFRTFRLDHRFSLKISPKRRTV